MTGQELNDLSTSLLQGRGLDITDFLVRANIAKNKFENERAWRKLVKIDTSKTSLTSDTYATTKDLPTDFRKTLPRRTLKLVSGTSVIECDEIMLEDVISNQSASGKFAIDHLNSTYSIMGAVSQTMTNYLAYIHKSADITADTSWVFPSEYHPYIAYEVTAMVELGEDYDDINARNANANAQVANILLKQAIKWDDSLQRSALGV